MGLNMDGLSELNLFAAEAAVGVDTEAYAVSDGAPIGRHHHRPTLPRPNGHGCPRLAPIRASPLSAPSLSRLSRIWLSIRPCSLSPSLHPLRPCSWQPT